MSSNKGRTSWLKTVGRLASGLQISLRHLKNAVKKPNSQDIQSPLYFKERSGIDTFTYPFQSLPIPEVGRYQLHNEIDDCIVCDKCAKVCPVDCIDIEAIKSPEEIGKTSDGSSKRLYAAKFDIDMAKCCFCGLCTTVCPTECLTMSSDYDYSVFSLTELNFSYSDLTPEKAQEKRDSYQLFLAEKEAAKASKTTSMIPSAQTVDKISDKEAPKKAFKPVFKKTQSISEASKSELSTSEDLPIEPLGSETKDLGTTADIPKKPFKPVFKKLAAKPKDNEDLNNSLNPNNPTTDQ